MFRFIKIYCFIIVLCNILCSRISYKVVEVNSTTIIACACCSSYRNNILFVEYKIWSAHNIFWTMAINVEHRMHGSNIVYYNMHTSRAAAFDQSVRNIRVRLRSWKYQFDLDWLPFYSGGGGEIIIKTVKTLAVLRCCSNDHVVTLLPVRVVLNIRLYIRILARELLISVNTS